jgi:hypothetical protein
MAFEDLIVVQWWKENVVPLVIEALFFRKKSTGPTGNLFPQWSLHIP